MESGPPPCWTWGTVAKAATLKTKDFYMLIARISIASLLKIRKRKIMNSAEAVAVLAALGQSTRLDTFRLLVQNDPGGLPAGEVAERLNVPRNTMSNHLAILARAGLVRAERDSRQIIYRADLSRLTSLTAFLVEDCCGGLPDLCTPMLMNLGKLNSC